MKKAKFQREGRVIIDLETGARKIYRSVNQAKKESHRIQMAEDDALGRGTFCVAS